MKLKNKKGLESRVVTELILGLIFVTIVIALIYFSFRNNDFSQNACLESLVLFAKLKDPSVIKCPYHFVNISSNDVVDLLLAKEVASCWVKFGKGDLILTSNVKNDKVVFCYTCSIIRNSYSDKLEFSYNDVYDNLLKLKLADAANFDENNLKIDNSGLDAGNLLYVYFVITKINDGEYLPHIEVSHQKKEFCDFETESLR